MREPSPQKTNAEDHTLGKPDLRYHSHGVRAARLPERDTIRTVASDEWPVSSKQKLRWQAVIRNAIYPRPFHAIIDPYFTATEGAVMRFPEYRPRRLRRNEKL